MKISFRTTVLIAALVGLVGCLFLSGRAEAQDIISQTNATMLTFQPAMTDTSSNNTPKETTPTPPKLYRERVPGKPEEGFVPVTAPTKNYQYTKVRYPYGEVLIFEDFIRRNVCYITINSSRIAESCVPMK